MTYDIAQ